MGDAETVWKDRELLDFSRKLSDEEGAQLSHVIWQPADAVDEYADRLVSMFGSKAWDEFPSVLERLPEWLAERVSFDTSSLTLKAGVHPRATLGRAAWLATNPWNFTPTQGLFVKYLLSRPSDEALSSAHLQDLLGLKRGNVSYQLSTVRTRFSDLLDASRDDVELIKTSYWNTRNPLTDDAREFLQSAESNREARSISEEWPVAERAVLTVLDRGLQDKATIMKRLHEATGMEFSAKKLYAYSRSLDERLQEAVLGLDIAIQDVNQRGYRALLSARGERIRVDVRRLNHLKDLSTVISVPSSATEASVEQEVPDAPEIAETPSLDVPPPLALEDSIDDVYASLRTDVKRWLNHPLLGVASHEAHLFQLLLDRIDGNELLPVKDGKLDLYRFAEQLGLESAPGDAPGRREYTRDSSIDDAGVVRLNADVLPSLFDDMDDSVVSGPQTSFAVPPKPLYVPRFADVDFEEEEGLLARPRPEYAARISEEEPVVEIALQPVPPKLDSSVYPRFNEVPASKQVDPDPEEPVLDESDFEAEDVSDDDPGPSRKVSKNVKRTLVVIDPFKSKPSRGFQKQHRQPRDPVKRVGAAYTREDGTVVIDQMAETRKRVTRSVARETFLPPTGARFSDRSIEPVQDGSAKRRSPVAYSEFFAHVADHARDVLSERDLLFPRWRGYYDASVKNVLSGRQESGLAPSIQDIREVLVDYSTRAFGSRNVKNHLLFMKRLLERERLDAHIEEKGVFSPEGIERFLPDFRFVQRQEFYHSLTGELGEAASADDVMSFYLGLKHGSQNGQFDLYSLTEAFLLNAGSLSFVDAHTEHSGYAGADQWAGKLLGIGSHPIWQRERLYIARNNMDVDTIVAGTQRKAKRLANDLTDYLRFRGFADAGSRLKVAKVRRPEGIELDNMPAQPEVYEVSRSSDDVFFGREGVVFVGDPFEGSHNRQRFTLPRVDHSVFPLFHRATREYVALGLGGIVPDRD